MTEDQVPTTEENRLRFSSIVDPLKKEISYMYIATENSFLIILIRHEEKSLFLFDLHYWYLFIKALTVMRPSVLPAVKQTANYVSTPAITAASLECSRWSAEQVTEWLGKICLDQNQQR